jgi:DNA-binding NtrC family response regulator
VPAGRILLVDDEEHLLNVLQLILQRDDHEVVTTTRAEEALRLYEEQEFDLVITDLKMPGMSGLELLGKLKERWPSAIVVVLTAFSTWDSAVAAMRIGAYGYLKKPFDNNEIRALVRRVMERKQVYSRLTKAGVDDIFHAGDIVGASPPILDALEIVRRIAPTDSTVVISGESGTGKELFARAIHYGSLRSTEPFVAVNCGAFTESLLESELFGHIKGSFTGAVSDRKGLFEVAHQGTVFLDEIGEMSPTTQVKLLRVLETHQVKPVGGSKPVPVDVRIIAATNRDLQTLVDQGDFRLDLFYRLDVIRIDLPPLRQRRGDIPLLAGHFLARYAKRLNASVDGFAEEAIHALIHADWPGNVRELENTVQRSVALCEGEEIQATDVMLRGRAGTAPVVEEPVSAELPEQGLDLEDHLADIERRIIRQALERTAGNLTRAAPLLGLSFRSLRYRVKKLGIKQQ